MAKHGEYGSYTDPDKPYYSSADRYNDWLYGGVAPREEEIKKKGSSSGSVEEIIRHVGRRVSGDDRRDERHLRPAAGRGRRGRAQAARGGAAGV